MRHTSVFDAGAKSRDRAEACLITSISDARTSQRAKRANDLGSPQK